MTNLSRAVGANKVQECQKFKWQGSLEEFYFWSIKGYFVTPVFYIICRGWEVDTGFIQPEVEGRGSDSPRAEPEGYHA